MTVSVLVVDDSATSRAALRRALESDPEIRIVGEATSGRQALSLLRRLKPDIITMDVLLGGHNGIDVTESIMSTTPRPILVVTSMNPSDPDLAYRAVRAGALDIWPKLPAVASPAYGEAREQLIRAVKSLSRVPVVHRSKVRAAATPRQPERLIGTMGPAPRVLVVGASTGGPPVVCSLLERLPRPTPVVVVIVQHIAVGFARGFAAWLGHSTGHDVRMVDEALEARAGTVYVAPDDRHIEFASPHRLATRADPPRHRHRPSIDTLFESAARHFQSSSIGVLLSGMGEDGVSGMAALRQAGALTIAQDPQTCAVDSMPRHALARRAAQLSLSPDAIGEVLRRRLPAGPPLTR